MIEFFIAVMILSTLVGVAVVSAIAIVMWRQEKSKNFPQPEPDSPIADLAGQLEDVATWRQRTGRG